MTDERDDGPPCFEPLIERSSQHEVRAGPEGLPGLRGVLHGYPFRFSFAVPADIRPEWDDPCRVTYHFVMDFPFGFDVRVRMKGKGKGRKGGERAKTGITGFDQRFEASARDTDLGRALPWLRDGAFQEVLAEFCKGKHEVRLAGDSLHVSGPARRGTVDETVEAIRMDEWPGAETVERIASAAQRLRGCLRRIAPELDAGASKAAALPATPAPPAAPAREPEAYEVIYDTPETPAPAGPAAAPEIVFLGDPVDRRPPPKPKAPDVIMIGFDEPEPPRRPMSRPLIPRPPISFTPVVERKGMEDWAQTWDVARLPQFAAMRQRCSSLALQRDKDGFPDVTGEVEGYPFVLRVRWCGGKRNLAEADDFSLECEVKCKPDFEAAVYRESWTLRMKQLLGSLEEIKVGRPALDDKYFYSFAAGSKGRFMDLMLDAETEPLIDALTELSGSVHFSYEKLRVGVTDKEVPRAKAHYDPFGEGVWPPGHFLDDLIPAAHGLAVRVNGLDTGLVFRRMRSF